MNSARGYIEEHKEEVLGNPPSSASLSLSDVNAIKRQLFEDGWNAALEVVEENLEFHDTMGDVKGDIEFLKTD